MNSKPYYHIFNNDNTINYTNGLVLDKIDYMESGLNQKLLHPLLIE